MYIALDETLTYPVRTREATQSPLDTLVEQLAEYKKRDLAKRTFSARGISLGPLSEFIPLTGYLAYVVEAYNRHLTVQLSPDIVWNLWLNKMATIICADPEPFRSVFSSQEGKQTIKVDSSVTDLRVDEFLRQLRALTPTDIFRDIAKPFSTTGPQQLVAHTVAAMAMASPFYEYEVYMCGLPGIELLGTFDDWVDLMDRITTILEMLVKTPAKDVQALVDYTAGLVPFLKELSSAVGQALGSPFAPSDENWWKSLFVFSKCGSGSQLEISGHICALLGCPQNHLLTKCGGGVTVGVPGSVTIKSLSEAGQPTYKFVAGILAANIVPVEGRKWPTLVPQWGSVCFQI